jgi:hypothetical protein
MKTVPKLRVVAIDDAAEIDLPDLPREVRVALADVAGVAREGLLAISVAAGLAVMQAMFEAEVTAACGLKGKHDPDRAAVRHGAGRGSVVLGGRRVPVCRLTCVRVNEPVTGGNIQPGPGCGHRFSSDVRVRR